MGRKQINWGSDDDFIANYLQLKSSRKMGELYNCDKSSILNHAKQIGFNPNEIDRGYKLSEQDKQEIKDSYNIMTSSELAKKYNVSRGMITKVWHDSNLKGKKNIKSNTTMIDLTGQRFGNLVVLKQSNKRAKNGGIYWYCKCDCGKEKEILGQSLRAGITLSCGNHSNISKGNMKIIDILDENGISYETEKKFNTCKDKRDLPFDFYVNNKYLIEYDGEQHFNPNSPFDYEYTHNHDKIKSQWCKDHNIPLIRIPYTHYNDLCLEDLLLETSNFIEK